MCKTKNTKSGKIINLDGSQNIDISVIAVPYQLCPKCNGDKQVLVNEWNGLETSISSGMQVCNICKGEGIIPMYIPPFEPLNIVKSDIEIKP